MTNPTEDAKVLLVDALLDSTQAARLLGVKRSTLYVYVSRGYLKPQRQPEAHRSLFSLAEVQALAERSGRNSERARLLPTLATSVTTVTPTGLAYRGIQTSALADTKSFEEVAELLWQLPHAPWQGSIFEASSGATPSEIIKSVVARFSSADHTSVDRSAEAVGAIARELIATVARTLAGAEVEQSPVAKLLCSGIGADSTNAAAVTAIDSLMVLLADHEFAPSTLAVRIASNVGSSLSNALLAGLGVLSGPLHDGSQRAYELIQEALKSGPAIALRRFTNDGAGPPGFDRERHDPRARMIGRHFKRLATPEQWSTYEALLCSANELDLPLPGIDIAIAALIWGLGACPDGGSTVFAVARMAGWTAHYLEETLEPARRFHFRPVYAAQPCARGTNGSALTT